MSEYRRPLSRSDKETVFRKATAGLANHYANKIDTGMTNDDLKVALEAVLGIFGGSCGPDQFCITFKGSGLKIWGSWEIHNHVVEKPLFAGRSTIAMARLIYGIKDPSDAQMQLL